MCELTLRCRLLSLKEAADFESGQTVRAHLPVGKQKSKSPDPLPAVVVNTTGSQTTVRYKNKYLGELTLSSSWVLPSWAMSYQFVPTDWIKSSPKKAADMDCSFDGFEDFISASGCIWKEPVHEDLPCVVADWGQWNPCSVTWSGQAAAHPTVPYTAELPAPVASAAGPRGPLLHDAFLPPGAGPLQGTRRARLAAAVDVRAGAFLAMVRDDRISWQGTEVAGE